MTFAEDDTAQSAPVEATPQLPDLAGCRLTVRADGDSTIGTGHLMRCLAVAARWTAAGGSARLACTAAPDALAERYVAAGAEVARQDSWLPADVLAGSDVVMLDAPHLPDAEMTSLADGPAVLLTLDDMADRARYPGDILLNQNAHATPAMYRGRTAALLCLGAPWCLLRAGFAELRNAPRPAPGLVGRILVLLGGADPKRYSATVLEATACAAATLTPPPEVVLVVGAANPALADLRRLAATLPGQVTVRHDVRDMPGLLATADLAVSAAGSTVWELATLGVPMILGAQNASERGPAAALQAAEAAVDLGMLERLRPTALAAALTDLAADIPRRRRMREAGMRQVDARGVDRLLALAARLIADRQPPSR